MDCKHAWLIGILCSFKGSSVSSLLSFESFKSLIWFWNEDFSWFTGIESSVSSTQSSVTEFFYMGAYIHDLWIVTFFWVLTGLYQISQEEASSTGVSSTNMLFIIAWKGTLPCLTFELHVLQIYSLPSNEVWMLK